MMKGMGNLGNMMRQAQEMQAKMAEMQQRMAEMEVEGEAGAGMVKVVLTGKGEAKRLTLDPKVVDPNDKDMLEDLIVAALNDARGKIDRQTQAETEKMMGGLQLPPGFKMPF